MDIPSDYLLAQSASGKEYSPDEYSSISLFDSSAMVVQDNRLINARYNFNIYQIRLFLFLVSKVRKEDKDFQVYSFSVKDLMQSTGVYHSEVYVQAKKYTKELMGKVFEIAEPQSKSDLLVACLSHARYFQETGVVEVSFSPELKPYLLDLKERFTQIPLRHILRLSSIYSIRLYQLLKQFEKIGERTMTVDELKAMFMVEEKYQRYDNFKRRIILKAQQDCAEFTDITFSFQEIKKGRTIDKIKFIIRKNKRNAIDPVEKTADPIPTPRQESPALSMEAMMSGVHPDRKESVVLLQRYGIDRETALVLSETYSLEIIRKAISNLSERLKDAGGKPIQNIPAYLLRLIEVFAKNEQAYLSFEEDHSQRKEEERRIKQQVSEQQYRSGLTEFYDQAHRSIKKFFETSCSETAKSILATLSDEDLMVLAEPLIERDTSVFAQALRGDDGRPNPELCRTEFYFNILFCSAYYPAETYFDQWCSLLQLPQHFFDRTLSPDIDIREMQKNLADITRKPMFMQDFFATIHELLDTMSSQK